MRVAPDGQAEVAGDRFVRSFDDILARAEQFDNGKRQIGKAERIGSFASGQKFFERLRIRLCRKREFVLGCDIDDPTPAFERADHEVLDIKAVKNGRRLGGDIEAQCRNHDRFILGLEQVVKGEIIKDALHQHDRPVLPDIAFCLFNAVKPSRC